MTTAIHRGEAIAQKPVVPVPSAEATTVPLRFELYLPERSVLDVAIACAIALFAMLWVRPLFSFTRFHGDEGIMLQGAVRILNGELPYRDFFSFYTPAGYYLYAALFRMFGTSMEVARAVLVFYAGFFAWLTYMLARRTSSRTASACCALLLALVCLPGDFVVTHNWESVAAAAMALYCAVWLLQTAAIQWAFLCGLLVGATAMVEQLRGAGLLLGLTIAAMAVYRLQPHSWKARHAIALVAGTALPVAATVGYFAWHEALRVMLSSWLWPLRQYTSVNRVPFGYLTWTAGLQEGFNKATVGEQLVMLLPFSGLLAIILIPLLGVWLSGAIAFKLWRRQLNPTPLVMFVMLCGSVLFGLVAAFAFGRRDWHHAAKLAPLSFFLLPLLLDLRLMHTPTLSRLRPLLTLWLMATFATVGLVLSILPGQAVCTVETRRGVLKTELPDEVLPYLQAHVRGGEKVLVYPYAPLYSFLSASMTPTRFDFLQAGMHSTAEFEEARRQVELDRTPAVLFDLAWRETIPLVWPKTPLPVIASDPMADYIFRQYKVCKTLMSVHDPFAYMVRRDLACPRN